jgi:hypothetical protein
MYVVKDWIGTCVGYMARIYEQNHGVGRLVYSNALDLYLVDNWFKSWPQHQISYQRVFIIFLSPGKWWNGNLTSSPPFFKKFVTVLRELHKVISDVSQIFDTSKAIHIQMTI